MFMNLIALKIKFLWLKCMLRDASYLTVQKGVEMLFRKTLFFVVTTVLICSSVMAHDSLDPPTVSLGIQHGHIKGFDDIKGGNFKVRYENSSP